MSEPDDAHNQGWSSLVALVKLWGLSLPLTPLLALLTEIGRQLDEIINGTPIVPQRGEDTRSQERREHRERKRVAQRSKGTSPFGREVLGLGVYDLSDTDTFGVTTGVVQSHGWSGITERALDEHLLIIGTTGAGKTETLKRIAYEVFTKTNRDLYLVDGKGELPFATSIRALAYQTGRGDPPVFRMGFEAPGARYNGFSGQAQAIYSRLVAMAGVANLEGNADIYGRITREFLQLACYAPEGPPRSFDELRKRLTVKWLQDTYGEDPVEKEIVNDTKLLTQRLEGVQLRLRPLIRELTAFTGSNGFTIEEVQAAIFSIRTQSVSDTGKQFLQYLIEDLNDFINKRQKRPAVLMIDEFASFGAENIVRLLALARSAHLGLILATQDVGNLGSQVTMRSILANTGTKLLMRSEFPEDIAKLAGTYFQLEGSVQYDQGRATGMGSVREQHAFRIDMNKAARLGAGEAYLIRHRRVAKLSIAALDEREVDSLIEKLPPQPSQPTPPIATQRKKSKKNKNID